MSVEKTAEGGDLENPSIDHRELTYPEGGRQAWFAVIGGWLCQFTTFGYTNAYGVYNDYYTREYLTNQTSFALSWVGSLQVMLVLSVGLLSGKLFDLGYFYPTVISGSVLFILCIFIISITQAGQYYQIFLAQGLGMGIAIGLIYVPSIAVPSQYFHKNRALAMGIVATGSGAGGALQPMMLNKLFYSSLGFNNAVRVSAAFNAVLLFLGVALMRTRDMPQSNVERSIFRNFKRYARDAPYVCTVLGTMFMYSGLYFPIFFLQLNAIQKGVPKSLAFYAIPVLNGASVIGRGGPTFFARKIGVYNVFIPCIASCMVLIFCTLAVNDLAGTMSFAALYGIFAGGCIGLMVPAVASLAKTQDEVGTRLGVCFLFTGLGGLIGSPVAGALLTSHYYWWRPVLYAGLNLGLSTVLLTASRIMLSQRKDTQII